MKSENITTVAELVDRLGGPTKTGKALGGVSAQTVWNWTVRGKLPTEKYLDHKAALDALGIAVPDALWFSKASAA
jgi:hypothetical protein